MCGTKAITAFKNKLHFDRCGANVKLRTSDNNNISSRPTFKNIIVSAFLIYIKTNYSLLLPSVRQDLIDDAQTILSSRANKFFNYDRHLPYGRRSGVDAMNQMAHHWPGPFANQAQLDTGGWQTQQPRVPTYAGRLGPKLVTSLIRECEFTSDTK